MILHSVSISRPDVLQGYEGFSTSNPGFKLRCRLQGDVHRKFEVKARLKDGTTINVGMVSLDIHKELIKLPVKLRKKVKWDDTHHSDMTQILQSLRLVTETENRQELVDEIETILSNRIEAVEELKEFIQEYGNNLI
jgi:hypothetical protein